MKYAFYSYFFFLLFPLYAQAVSPAIEESRLKPYYEYDSEHLQEIKETPTDHEVTTLGLEKWDRLVESFLQNRPFSAGKGIRIFTYLYSAQADFAYLSKMVHGEIRGSIDPVSLGIVRLFYPFFPMPNEMVIDEFSIVLARMVVDKYKQRLMEEEAAKQKITDYFSVQNLSHSHHEFGKEILSWQPWILQMFSQQLTLAPPAYGKKGFWPSQLKQVYRTYRNVSRSQKKFAENWGDFFEQGGGNWLKFINNYIFSEALDLGSTLYIRLYSLFSMYDALIISFEAKYAHLIPAPYTQNAQIVPFVSYSYYPSYPSSHGVLSYVSAQLMSHFFPNQKQKWMKLAEMVGKSRVWAGMNYPIDIEASKRVGEVASRQFLKGVQP